MKKPNTVSMSIAIMGIVLLGGCRTDGGGSVSGSAGETTGTSHAVASHKLDGPWKIKFIFHSTSECHSDRFHEMDIANGKMKGVAYYGGDTLVIRGSVDEAGIVSAAGQGRVTAAKISGQLQKEKGYGDVSVNGEAACIGTWEAVRRPPI